MPIGDPGKEQFRDAQVTTRNIALVAYLGQVFLLRSEFLAQDEVAVRGGFDTATLLHLNAHLANCDRWRRRITHNPEGRDLRTLIEDARDTKGGLTLNEKSPAGDEIQGATGGLIQLPFAIDGTDPNIPLNSQLQLRNPMALTILGAIDRHIVTTTRVEDRHATNYITPSTSLVLYNGLQQIYTLVNTFGGDENRLHVAGGTLPTEEPRGPEASANRRNEAVGVAGRPSDT